MAKSLKFLSLNVKGFNSPHKRNMAFRQIRPLHVDVLCLQETHFTVSSHPKFLNPQFPQVFMANDTTKHRGVLICFNISAPFICSRQISDPTGRYLLLTGTLRDQETTIVTYYAPNSKQIPFFKHLLALVDTHRRGSLIICGDSNTSIHPSIDRSPYIPSRSDSSAKTFRSLLAQYSLTDCWREANPSSMAYTFYSHPHATYSRIDHFFLPHSLLPTMLASSIIPFPWSDHQGVTLTLSSLWAEKVDRTWSLNETLLTDPTTKLALQNSLLEYHNQ